MFLDRELKATKELCDRKIDDILEDKGEFTADTLRDLRTLIVVRDAADKKVGYKGPQR